MPGSLRPSPCAAKAAKSSIWIDKINKLDCNWIANKHPDLCSPRFALRRQPVNHLGGYKYLCVVILSELRISIHFSKSKSQQGRGATGRAEEATGVWVSQGVRRQQGCEGTGCAEEATGVWGDNMCGGNRGVGRQGVRRQQGCGRPEPPAACGAHTQQHPPTTQTRPCHAGSEQPSPSTPPTRTASGASRQPSTLAYWAGTRQHAVRGGRAPCTTLQPPQPTLPPSSSSHPPPRRGHAQAGSLQPSPSTPPTRTASGASRQLSTLASGSARAVMGGRPRCMGRMHAAPCCALSRPRGAAVADAADV